ncbi:MAG: hypothetical protein JKY95_16450 [Planctomycetaceae bacterium]|nr:hypothetical protein [Planctomycetaceae bacterium]
MNDLELWQLLRRSPDLLAEIKSATGSDLHIQKQLRKKYPADLVRLGLELVLNRSRAPAKFSRADQLWLTRQALEQATSEQVAAHKTKRFAEYGSPVWDLCSGMGGDAIALAQNCLVHACDLDAVILQLASWNAEVYQVADKITFHHQDVNQLDVTGKVIHIDPDQRDVTGRRHLRLEQIQPDLSRLQQMVEDCKAGMIKLSPASNFGGKFPDCEAELLSLRGECKAANIWCGELAQPGLWRATVLPSGETIAGDPLSAWPEMGSIQSYFYDPDPSLVRSGLVNLFAEQNSIARLDDAEEYLTCDELIESPFVTGFQVVDVLNRNERQLRKYLREHNIGTVEIKCRHVPVDIEKLRRSLPLKGEKSITLVYARVAGKTQVVICQRV